MSTYPRVYDEKTGNPAHDNLARKVNRKLAQLVNSSLRIGTPGGRRRKKYITTQTHIEYADLLVSTARHLTAQATR